MKNGKGKRNTSVPFQGCHANVYGYHGYYGFYSYYGYYGYCGYFGYFNQIYERIKKCLIKNG